MASLVWRCGTPGDAPHGVKATRRQGRVVPIAVAARSSGYALAATMRRLQGPLATERCGATRPYCRPDRLARLPPYHGPVAGDGGRPRDFVEPVRVARQLTRCESPQVVPGEAAGAGLTEPAQKPEDDEAADPRHEEHDGSSDPKHKAERSKRRLEHQERRVGDCPQRKDQRQRTAEGSMALGDKADR